MRPRRRLRVADLESLAQRGLIVETLDHHDHRIRAAAIPLVAAANPETAAEFLIPRLGDSEWLVRQATIRTLGSLGIHAVPAVLDTLEANALEDDNAFIQFGTAEVLIKVAALLDTQQRVRAVSGLSRLTSASGDVGRAARDALAAVEASADPLDDEERQHLRERLMDRRSFRRAEARRDLAWIVGSTDNVLRSAYEAGDQLDDVLNRDCDRAAAIATLESVVEAEPGFFAAHLELSRLHRAGGSAADAIRHAEAALVEDEFSAQAWVEAGLVHVAAEEAAKALSSMVTAIAIDPGYSVPRLRCHVDPLFKRMEAWGLLAQITEVPVEDAGEIIPSTWSDTVAATSPSRLRTAMLDAVDHLPSGVAPLDWMPSRAARRRGLWTDDHAPVDTRSRTVRVFVSSTFRDFHAERDLLVRRAFPELRRRCKERFVDVVDIDLRWGIRQEEAERGEALTICLAELDRCRPFFIGLLGQTFGTSVDEAMLVDYPWIRRHRPHSFTEIEIRYALRSSQTSESLFYFRDPAYLRQLSLEDRPEFVSDTESDTEALDALKEEVQGIVTVAGGPKPRNYEHPRELADMVLEDLWAAIDRRFPAADVPDRAAQQRVPHAATAKLLTRAYAPREDDLSRLDDHVSRMGAPLVLIGAPGAGKSALLANWARRSRRNDPSLRVVEHYIPNAASAESPNDLISHIASELDGLDLIPLRIGDRDAGGALAAVLRRAAEESDVVVLVDGVDRLQPQRGHHPLAWIPQPMPRGVWLVCSAGPGEIADELKRRGWSGHTLTELSETDRVELINTYLDRFGKRLQSDLVNRVATAPLCANPRFLTSVLEELRVFGGFAELAAHTDSYLKTESVEALYDMVLARLEADFISDDPGLVKACFASLWASRRGLTESELIEATQMAAHEVPRHVWSTLLAAVDAWVPADAGVMSIGSESFRSAVAARYLSTADDRRRAHRRLAGLFTASLDDRANEELAWQLARAEEWERLFELLADPDLVSTLHATDATATLEYWADVEAATGKSRDDAYAPVVAAPERYATSVWQIADILEDGGFVERALILREWIAEKMTGVDDAGSRAAAVGDLGIALRLTGDWQGALNRFRQQEQLARAVGDADMLAKALTNAGLVLGDLGSLSEALQRHEEAEEICRARDDWIGLSTALGNQALVLGTIGEFERSEALLNEQIRVSRQVDDTVGVMVGLGNLGSLKLRRDDVDTALEHFREQERLARRGGARHALVRALTSLGSVAAEQGRLDEALRLQAESAAICREIGDDVGLAGALGNRSVVMHRLGELDAALELSRDEERICRRLGHPPGLAHSMMQQALLFVDLGDRAAAMLCLREARDLWQSLGDGPNLMRVAHLLSELGRDEEAAEVVLEAQGVRSKNPSIHGSDSARSRGNTSGTQP